MQGCEDGTSHPCLALYFGGDGWGCKVQERHGSDQSRNNLPAAAIIVASSAHNTQRNVISLSCSYIWACEQEGRIDEALVAFEKQVCLAAGYVPAHAHEQPSSRSRSRKREGDAKQQIAAQPLASISTHLAKMNTVPSKPQRPGM